MRLKGYHEAQLVEHFERIVETGATSISSYKLRAWVDQERITVTVWRTIQTYWEEFLKNTKTVPAKQKEMALFVGDTEHNLYTFIWGEGLIETKDTWFKALKSWT